MVITQHPHLESLEDLPGVYYAWVENICSQESIEWTNPLTDQIDENQNNVWGVNLGLTSLGYLHYMSKMGVLLVQKKKLDRTVKKLSEERGNDSAVARTKEKIK